MKFTISFSLLAIFAAFTLGNAQVSCGEDCWNFASTDAGNSHCDPSDFDCLCHNANFSVFASRCLMHCEDGSGDFVTKRCAPFTSTPAAPTPVATA